MIPENNLLNYILCIILTIPIFYFIIYLVNIALRFLFLCALFVFCFDNNRLPKIYQNLLEFLHKKKLLVS